LHALVAVAFLQSGITGGPSATRLDAHSTDVLPLPVAQIAILESPPPSEESPPSSVTGNELARIWGPASVELPELARISLPPEPEVDSAKERTLAGTVQIQCEVHIHQSPRGEIQAIDFGRCLGDTQWQHSLMAAIERAAGLIHPSSTASFPAVRTLTVMTDSPSSDLLARQLSADPDTTDRADPTAH
jgi:hypothetical protein